MSTHRRLGHVSRPAGGPVGGAHRAPSTWTVRAWPTRGILAVALALGGLGGAAAAASPGHRSAGHVHAIAHQSAGSPALPADAGSTSVGHIYKLPWMY
jgi:hypothetical protein